MMRTVADRVLAFRRLSGLLLALCFIAAALPLAAPPSPASAAPAIDPNAYYKIVARHSGKVLDVDAFSTADGANVQQWTDHGGTNQQWSLVQVGGGSSGSCEDFATLTMGKYWINNNVWGQDSGSGWQCIWGNSVSGSTINWGTNWEWSGQSHSVKSYASAVLGWHWGWKLSNTGLPVQLSANRNINTSWNYRVTLDGANTMNVAYDLWLHTIPNPDHDDQPTDEVMIWLYSSGGAGPAGTRQATVTIAGTTWDLYRGWIAIDQNGNGWNVYSFVRTSNTTSATLYLRDFLNLLVSRGWVSNSKYLNSVQAGTEIFIGKGQLDTDSYPVNIQ